MCEVGEIFRGRSGRTETVEVVDEGTAHTLEASLVLAADDEESFAGMMGVVNAVGESSNAVREFSLLRIERLQDDVAIRATHPETTDAHAPLSLGDGPGRQFRRHRHIPFVQRNSRIRL